MNNRTKCGKWGHLLLSGLLAVGLTGALHAEQVFKATFNKGMEPEIANGFALGAEGVFLPGDGIGGTQGATIEAGKSIEYSIDNQMIDQLFEQNEGTVELWVRPNGWKPDDEHKFFTFLSIGMEGENNQLLIYKWHDSNDIYFLAGDASLPYEKKPLVGASINEWRADEWHMLTMTWNGRQLACYVDGVLVNRRNIDESKHWQTYGFTVKLRDRLRIGAPQFDPAYPSAQVDEVAIFNECLPDEQIKTRFDSRQNNVTNGESLSLPVPATKRAPVIDGRLKPEEWKNATVFSGFSEGINERDTRMFPLTNKVLLQHDAENLYIGLLSETPAGKPLRTMARKDDSDNEELQVWKDDCFEVLVAGEHSQQAIYLFQINSLGFGKSLQGFNPKWRSRYRKAAHADDKHFYAELAIPLKELRNTPFQAGEKIYLQISRSYKNGGTDPGYAMLNSSMGLMDISRFAELTLTDSEAGVVCEINQKDLDRGELNVEGTVPASLSEAQGNRLLKATIHRKETGENSTIDGIWEGDKFRVDEKLSGGSYAVALRVGNTVSVKKNFDVQKPLALSKRIWSNRMEMELTANLGGLAKSGNDAFSNLELKVAIFDAESGKIEARSAFPVQKKKDLYRLSIKGISAGEKLVKAEVFNKHGNQALAEAEIRYQQFGVLEGSGSMLGISDKVPAPWTPVTAGENNTIAVWNREYRFGENLLPEQIRVADKEIFAGKPCYEVEYADGTVESISGGVPSGEKKATPTRVEFAGTAEGKGIRVEQTNAVEFDGVTRCDVKVAGSKDIRRLSLVVPLKPEYAGFFLPLIGPNHPGATPPVPKNPLVPEGYHWNSNEFFYSLTLTSLDGGFAWFAQSPKTWKVDLGKDYQEVVRRDGRCDLVIHFVNTSAPGVRNLEFIYGLQTLPSRPPHPDFRKHELGNFTITFEPTTGHFEMLEKYRSGEKVDRETMATWAILPQGNIPRGLEDMKNPEQYGEIKQWRDQLMKGMTDQGLQFGIYSAPTYSSERLPEWDFFGEEWSGIPKTRFPMFMQPRISVSNQGWVNFYLTNLDRYVRRYPAEILMFDVADPQGDCSEINGMGYTREDGITYPEYPIWETRELYRRTVTVLKDAHPHGWTISASECPAYSGFFDYLIRETYLHMIKTRYFEKSWWGLPFDEEMKIWYKINYGPKVMFLPAFSEITSPADITHQVKPTVHHYGIMLLFDLPEWPMRVNMEVRNQIIDLRRKFGFGVDETIKFHPYYELEGKVTTSNPSTKASVYTAEDKLMIVVTNLSPGTDFNGEVAINLKQFGISNASFVAELYDPISNTFQDTTYSQSQFATGVIESGMHKVIIVTQGNAKRFGNKDTK